MPLDIIGADTQGSIGYMVQQALRNSLRAMGIAKNVISLVTQTEVDKNDPAFQRPSKPIGGFFSQRAGPRFQSGGWAVIEQARRGCGGGGAFPRPCGIVRVEALPMRAG